MTRAQRRAHAAIWLVFVPVLALLIAGALLARSGQPFADTRSTQP
jgi:paraquat-inducible protein B